MRFNGESDSNEFLESDQQPVSQSRWQTAISPSTIILKRDTWRWRNEREQR
jgi:hypothetical protein